MKAIDSIRKFDSLVVGICSYDAFNEFGRYIDDASENIVSSNIYIEQTRGNRVFFVKLIDKVSSPTFQSSNKFTSHSPPFHPKTTTLDPKVGNLDKDLGSFFLLARSNTRKNDIWEPANRKILEIHARSRKFTKPYETIYRLKRWSPESMEALDMSHFDSDYANSKLIILDDSPEHETFATSQLVMKRFFEKRVNVKEEIDRTTIPMYHDSVFPIVDCEKCESIKSMHIAGRTKINGKPGLGTVYVCEACGVIKRLR